MSSSSFAPPAPPAMQLIVPFAACEGEAWRHAMAPAALPQLGKLLRGMRLSSSEESGAQALTPPHENAIARALGFGAPDGLLPWAALEAGGAHAAIGQGWAFVTPCHWAMGREHATLSDPAALGLTEAESRELLAAMQPYFATEGITLHYAAPTRWLAEGEALRALPTASLDRVLGRNVDSWLPATTTAGSLRRLQNEMQMLLYTHPLNEQRAEQRQLPVNSFWLSGSGTLAAAAPAWPAALQAPRELAQAAFAGDWDAYAVAWAALDAGPVAALLAEQQAGRPVRLCLCGENRSDTYDSASPGPLARLARLFQAARPLAALERLIA